MKTRLPAAPAGVRDDDNNPGNRARQLYFSTAERRETDTYSVFARFRKTRLPLARRVSLQRAFSFAETVRKERFRNPEDVFVVHDRSGETVVGEATAIDPPAAIEAARDTPPAREIETASELPPSAEIDAVRADAPPDDLLDRVDQCRASARRNMDQLNRSVKELRSLLHDASTTFAAAAELYLKARSPPRD